MTFKLSEDTIEFIKKYVMEELSIKNDITEEDIEDIVDFCAGYECLLAEDGSNKEFNITKCLEASKVVADITGKWSNSKVDLVDLNARLK